MKDPANEVGRKARRTGVIRRAIGNGPEDFTRPRHGLGRAHFPQQTTYELSYASMNWIRFEGSLCRAARRAYQPLSPLPGLP
jgi:hypothetical protein